MLDLFIFCIFLFLFIGIGSPPLKALSRRSIIYLFISVSLGILFLFFEGTYGIILLLTDPSGVDRAVIRKPNKLRNQSSVTKRTYFIMQPLGHLRFLHHIPFNKDKIINIRNNRKMKS